MLAPDILNLRRFYATPFGEAVRAVISSAISHFWPSANGEAVLGIGYATPYLAPYLGQASILACSMPPAQGAEYWPEGKDNLVLISHDSELPFAENSIGKVLLVHSLENSEQLSFLLQEIWRVLAPGGKLLAVVPNRGGMWSRSHHSPFGYGRPFSMAQMRELLGEQNFAISKASSALFIPPIRLKFLWQTSIKLQKAGRKFCRFFGDLFGIFWGGVLLVEAEKKIYAAIPEPIVAAKKYRPVILGARPAMTKLRKSINKIL